MRSALEAARHIVVTGGAALAFGLPLLFNPYALYPFEPVKVDAVRLVAAAMLAVWVTTRIFSQRGPLLQRLTKPSLRAGNPLLVPAAGLVGAQVIATIASTNTISSLTGAPWNHHGLISLIALVIVFVLLADSLQGARPVETLFRASVWGSVPVAVYGFLQFLGLDPLAWITDSVSPVLSTIGRSNFVGAYLSMAIPLTLYLIAVRRRAGHSGGRLVVVLALQMGCLWLTMARAAVLGFMAGSVLFFAMPALRWRIRALAGWASAAALAGVAMLASLSAPAYLAPVSELADRRQAELDSLTDLRQASISSRVILWQGTARLIPRRWLVGYGPETFAEVFNAAYPGILVAVEGAATRPNDPHNLILNEAFGAGILGLLALAWLFVGFWRAVIEALRRPVRVADAFRLAAISGVVAAYLVQAMFNAVNIGLEAQLWMALAMGVACAAATAPASASLPAI